MERWSARTSRTSRRLHPERWMLRAATVMKLRRPECEEQPSNPSALNSATNQLTTELAVRLRRRRCDGRRRSVVECGRFWIRWSCPAIGLYDSHNLYYGTKTRGGARVLDV